MQAQRVVTMKKTALQFVTKRSGEQVAFDEKRILTAVTTAMEQCEEGGPEDARVIARAVVLDLQKAARLSQTFVPTVEGIQDLVETELIKSGFAKTAKHYILYRQKRADMRSKFGVVPDHVKKLVEESKKYFRNPLAEFIYFRTYSRWIREEKRRETWIETVDRYMSFMKSKVGNRLSEMEYDRVRTAILKMEVMPSMRLMWSAGEAAEKSNVAAFNCSFIAPSHIRDFGEILYILCCGTGVGFSVEAENVEQLPRVLPQLKKKPLTHAIPDSKEGWADALVHGMQLWYSGLDVTFDYSQIRPEGARLETMGGRASGPEPLRALLNFTREKMLSRQGRRLSTIDVHDIVCKIGDVVVSGGVRRSALISLSDLDDHAMRHAKEGHFFLTQPQRQMSNNSAVYKSKPSDVDFLREWLALVESQSGERGIFNRGSLPQQIPARRKAAWVEQGVLNEAGEVVQQVGTNPCGEITLKSKQFCNLTEVVCRSGDTLEDLVEKIQIATLLGTYQSMLTDFKYLSDDWAQNCNTERLLGVSLTGLWDCVVARDKDTLKRLQEESIATNFTFSKRFNIPSSTSVTCIKPSGTVSQLVDASSGMHTRYAPYYIRRVRIASTDSLFKMLRDQGVKYYPEVGSTLDTATTFVFEFPVQAPNKHVKRQTAKAQLEFWKTVKTHYTEHNPSVTVTVDNDEWMDTANWVLKEWDIVGGLSFLPKSDHVYQLAPYEEITKERYEEMVKMYEGIDYSKIVTYENEDETQGSKELACVGGVCEI